MNVVKIGPSPSYKNEKKFYIYFYVKHIPSPPPSRRLHDSLDNNITELEDSLYKISRSSVNFTNHSLDSEECF